MATNLNEVEKTIQEQLADAIGLIFKDILIKKINKDNYLDIHIPEVCQIKGSHLFFNTTSKGIKIGFYCRDKGFNDKVLEISESIEEFSQGLRISGNPTFANVITAVSGALSFISDLQLKSNLSLSSNRSNDSEIFKNLNFIELLESFNSETDVMVQMYPQYGIKEVGNGSGLWNGNFYTFDYFTYWNEGYLENTEAISVHDLINLLHAKNLEAFNQDDFDSLYLGTIRDGTTTYENFHWDIDVQVNELKNVPSEIELCEAGDKLDSEYFWESPERVEFLITEDDKDDVNYVLYSNGIESKLEEIEENVEEELLLDEFNFSEYDIDNADLLSNASFRIKNEKVLTGLIYVPNQLIAMGYDEVQNPFFFTSLVQVSEKLLPGFLIVNVDGFFTNCYINNEIQFIFSWDNLTSIKVLEEDELSIKIELISNKKSLIICEPYSKNLKLLLAIYDTIWKDVISAFDSLEDIDWDYIQNEMGVSIVVFESHYEYINWIEEVYINKDPNNIGLNNYSISESKFNELQKADDEKEEIEGHNEDLEEIQTLSIESNTFEMQYHTSIFFAISLLTGDDLDQSILKLLGIKKFILETSSTYEFEFLIDNKVVKGEDVEMCFDQFIEFLKLNLKITKEENLIIDYGSYQSDNIPDLEAGEIEFEKSFILTEQEIYVIVNTNQFYASELEKLTNQNLDVFACMNDIDGDYYEFEF